MRITVLIDNTASETDPSLASELGLSLHLSHRGRTILFDCGASAAFAANAEALHISLEAVDAAVLSHHHYDHGGGARHFFEVNNTAPLFLGEAPAGHCYSLKEDQSWKYVGLDAALLEEGRARLRWISGNKEIFPGVYLLPAASRKYPVPAGNRSLYLKGPGQPIHDPFGHELLMVVEEGGLVVFTGCAHCGLLNLLDTVSQHFPKKPISALIGGLHLTADQSSGRMLENEAEVRALAQAVLEYPVAMIHTGHCTCAQAYAHLQTFLSDKIAPLYSGAVIEV